MDKNRAIEKFTALQRDLNGLYARTENEADRFLIDEAANVISALADGCQIRHKTMFLKQAVGTATRGSNEYELYLVDGQTPMVVNKATGRQFLVLWQAVLDLAAVAGIDEEAV